MQRVPFQQIYDEFYRVLVKNGFVSQNADLCARIFAESTRDGVHSHSLNRFPSFVQSINSDFVDIGATPERVGTFGVLEQWDGRMGIGLLNASFCMDRALALARKNGLGCVALKNTNHWMRAGSYGLQAADAGCIGICWTNTTRLMPPWGSAERRLGNNPLVVAVPRAQGHIILDIAMSQFANGKLQIYRDRGEELPVEGGYDREGQPTTDARAILDSQRPLPIGDCFHLITLATQVVRDRRREGFLVINDQNSEHVDASIIRLSSSEPTPTSIYAPSAQVTTPIYGVVD